MCTFIVTLIMWGKACDEYWTQGKRNNWITLCHVMSMWFSQMRLSAMSGHNLFNATSHSNIWILNHTPIIWKQMCNTHTHKCSASASLSLFHVELLGHWWFWAEPQSHKSGPKLQALDKTNNKLLFIAFKNIFLFF